SARLHAQPAVARVYARTKSLLVGDSAQQRVQLLPLLHSKSGANGIIVFAGNTSNLFCCTPAGSREVQRVAPPVRGILAAFDQPSFLEFIQERDELAGQDGQAPAQLLLAEPRRDCDQPENARVRTNQA